MDHRRDDSDSRRPPGLGAEAPPGLATAPPAGRAATGRVPAADQGDGNPGETAAAAEELGHLQLALTLCPTPAALIDARGVIRHANAAFERLFGHEPGRLDGQPVEALLPVPMRRAHIGLRHAFMTAPTNRLMARRRDVQGLRADGTAVPVEVSLAPVHIGADTWIFTTVFDVTRRKMNEELLRRALNASASAIVMVDENGLIEMVNATACELLGGFSSELVGRSIDDFVPLPVRDAHSVFRANYWADPRTRTMKESNDLHVVGLDGKQTPVHIALTPINGSTGRSVLATIIDLSEFLATQRKLKQQNDRLAAANDELTQFAYSASHNLRAPLATISGLLELCIEDLDDREIEECRRNIGKALDTSRSNIRMVEAVLTLARAGQVDEPASDVDLVTLCRRCWDAMPPPRPAFTIRQDQALRVETEAGTLTTALTHLFDNACHFTDPDKPFPWVAVDIQRSGDGVRLEVRDNGPGIAPQEQERVFELFRHSANSKGHGLGLPTVQKHVRRVGGAIRLDSSAQGTCVTLDFPHMKVTA